MKSDFELAKRKYVIGGAAVVIIVVYLLRLFTLQLLSEDFKISADSNAFLKRIQYPARGAITDRNGKLLVYNQPAYDVMVIMTEQIGVDTLDLCESLDITRDWYERRMAEIKDTKRNPGYSPYTQQLFMSQLSTEEFWLLHPEAQHPPIQLPECRSPFGRHRRSRAGGHRGGPLLSEW